MTVSDRNAIALRADHDVSRAEFAVPAAEQLLRFLGHLFFFGANEWHNIVDGVE